MPSRFLRSLLLRSPADPSETPPLPRPDPPVCVVGDVHGCAALLGQLLGRIAAEPGADRVRLILAGDMIDRGPDSAAVLARVQALCRGGRAVALMGNHERMMLDFLDTPAQVGPVWLANGGDATLLSLGVNPRRTPGKTEEMQALATALRAALPPGTEDWLRALPLSWRPDGPDSALAVSHAGADPALPFEDQDDRMLLWGHRDFRRRARTDGLWIVHGHVISREVTAEDGRIGTDTGAFATGRLSAVWLDRDGMQVITAQD
jgi:serine/threonine protein phosphatase 1